MSKLTSFTQLKSPPTIVFFGSFLFLLAFLNVYVSMTKLALLACLKISAFLKCSSAAVPIATFGNCFS